MTNHECVAPRGKVVGGSSTINDKGYVRGNREDYDNWQRMGNLGWSYREVLPYFIKTENSEIDDGDSGFHGTSGLLDINYIEPTIFTPIFLEAMKELGLEVLDYNGRNQIGASRIQFTIKGNKIASGGRAFIQPFLSRENLKVTPHAFVTKLLTDRRTKTAYGVEFIKNGRIYNARALKEVIVSAGSVNSPQILMLSGIGPKVELENFGIDTIVDLPVGKYLQDHPLLFVLNFRTNQTLFNESLATLLEDYLNGHRPFTAPLNSDAVAFVNVNNKMNPVPDIQYIQTVPPGAGLDGFRALNLNAENIVARLRDGDPYSDIQILLFMLQPRSRGSVTLKSRSALDFPNIDNNFYSDPEGKDIETMYKGILHILKILDTDSFKSVNTTLSINGDVCNAFPEFSKEFWFCIIQQFTSTGYHLVGTTRMGTSARDSVVSPRLNVHEMRGLRVVDAGVIPQIPSGNVLGPTYMIAEKAADNIKECYGII